jgi:hypothetical protein
MGIRDRFVALGQSRSEAEADELRSRLALDETPPDVTPLSSCSPGDVVCVMGTIRSVTIRPAGRAPGTDIEIFDGSGSVNVVWMGRRRMAGISAGRGIIVHGRMTCTTENPTIYNPRYELAPISS